MKQLPTTKASVILTLLLSVLASACGGSSLKPAPRVGASGGAAKLPKGDIRLSLAHAFDGQNDDYEILLSAPVDTEDMVVCEVVPDDECEPESANYFPTDLIYETAKRRFFKASASALLEDGLILSFLVLDGAGDATGRRTVVVKLEENGEQDESEENEPSEDQDESEDEE